MARIQVIPPSRAGGRLHEAYAAVAVPQQRSLPLPTPNIMQVFSLRPDYLEAVGKYWHTLWSGTLSRVNKEMIAVAVSKATQCHY